VSVSHMTPTTEASTAPFSRPCRGSEENFYAIKRRPTCLPCCAGASFVLQRNEPLFIEDDFKFPLEAFSIPPQYKGYLSHVLLPHGMIVDRTDKLAEDIRAQYPTSTPHILVVLKVRSLAEAKLAPPLASVCSPQHQPPPVTPLVAGRERVCDGSYAVAAHPAHLCHERTPAVHCGLYPCEELRRHGVHR